MPPRGPRRLLWVVLVTTSACGSGLGVDARGDQARVVRHVDHEDRADRLGHTGEALEVDAQAVGRCAGDDQLGPGFVGQALHGVVVDGLVGIQPVADDLEPPAAHVQRHAVGQVAAFGQAHAHDGVARLQQGEEHRLVGLAAAVGLHVGEVGAEKLLGALDGQGLDDVDVFAATVVALARIALGVLVGELRALRLHHGRRGVVLAGDELDVLFLAAVFGLHGGPGLGVDEGECGLGTVEHGGPREPLETVDGRGRVPAKPA